MAHTMIVEDFFSSRCRKVYRDDGCGARRRAGTLVLTPVGDWRGYLLDVGVTWGILAVTEPDTLVGALYQLEALWEAWQ